MFKKIEKIPKPKNESKTKTKKDGTYKPIKIDDKEMTMEEFEQYQKAKQQENNENLK